MVVATWWLDSPERASLAPPHRTREDTGLAQGQPLQEGLEGLLGESAPLEGTVMAGPAPSFPFV